MRAPRFSAIIPSYNAERTIAATIRSVVAQTERSLELVVVDDGSTDRTAELIGRVSQEDARVRLIRQRNQGVAAARNTGIGATNAEYVSFLDNDDLWMPQYLARMGAVLDRSPDAGFGFCDGWSLDDSSKRIGRRSLFASSKPPRPLPPTAEDQLLRLAEDNFVWGSVTVRRSALEAAGGFDPAVNGVDDYDLWLRLLVAGHRAVLAEGRLILQRHRADSASQDHLMMVERLSAVCRRLADNSRASPEARARAAARLATLDARAAALRGQGGTRGFAYRARRTGAAVANRILKRWRYPQSPPPEVAEALRSRDLL